MSPKPQAARGGSDARLDARHVGGPVGKQGQVLSPVGAVASLPACCLVGYRRAYEGSGMPSILLRVGFCFCFFGWYHTCVLQSNDQVGVRPRLKPQTVARVCCQACGALGSTLRSGKWVARPNFFLGWIPLEWISVFLLVSLQQEVGAKKRRATQIGCHLLRQAPKHLRTCARIRWLRSPFSGAVRHHLQATRAVLKFVCSKDKSRCEPKLHGP